MLCNWDYDPWPISKASINAECHRFTGFGPRAGAPLPGSYKVVPHS